LQHGYARPAIGYVDIDRLIACAGPGVRWESLIERAVAFRARTAVYVGLLAAHRLLGTPVPAHVLEALRPTGLRLRALHCLAHLEADDRLNGPLEEVSGVRQVVTYATIADRPRDVVRMVQSVLLPDREWLAVRYSLVSKRGIRRARFTHPLRVARASLRALRRPLIRSGLDRDT